jgi:hypothetical protein
MPYIKRNEDGDIMAVYQEQHGEVNEFLPPNHPEISKFLHDNEIPLEAIRWQLTEADISLIRAIEDLIDILIDKNVINITDLPTNVVNKIQLRKRMREQLHWFDDVIIETKEV